MSTAEKKKRKAKPEEDEDDDASDSSGSEYQPESDVGSDHTDSASSESEPDDDDEKEDPSEAHSGESDAASEPDLDSDADSVQEIPKPAKKKSRVLPKPKPEKKAKAKPKAEEKQKPTAPIQTPKDFMDLFADTIQPPKVITQQVAAPAHKIRAIDEKAHQALVSSLDDFFGAATTAAAAPIPTFAKCKCGTPNTTGKHAVCSRCSEVVCRACSIKNCCIPCASAVKAKEEKKVCIKKCGACGIMLSTDSASWCDCGKAACPFRFMICKKCIVECNGCGLHLASTCYYGNPHAQTCQSAVKPF